MNSNQGRGRIESHRDLRVWQDAMEDAMDVFMLSKRFPPEERYSLTDQIRRSSRSVAANLSEAWRRRRYEAAFLSKLNDCETEAGETQTWLEICLRSGYVSVDEAHELDERYEGIIKQIVAMIVNPSPWLLLRKSSRNQK
jgi:four helix bundle protein